MATVRRAEKTGTRAGHVGFSWGSIVHGIRGLRRFFERVAQAEPLAMSGYTTPPVTAVPHTMY